VSTANGNANGFRDYYETLQLSPNAAAETISRVYRILVKRYHPDNPDTGDSQRFTEILEAYRVLSDPEKRTAYDVVHAQNRAMELKIFEDASAADGFQGDSRIIDGILSILYVARRRDPARGGLGIVQLERMLACPSEHLEFHVWYLLEKNWIQRLSNGMLAITVGGVDRMIESDALVLRRDRMIAGKSSAREENLEKAVLQA
jgi:curved DNA-binding protein